MWRKRSDRDFDEEIRAHLDLEAARLRQEGLTDDEAKTAAARGFGNVTAARERFYETGRWTWLNHALRDLRYGARRLRKDATFSVGVVFLLALGIGATTAIFSIVNGVLLQPLAYPDADRIVSVETFWTNMGRASRSVSSPDFRDWRAQNHSLAVMAYHAGDELTAIVRGRAEYANIEYVSEDFFTVFGQTAFAGRLLDARDQRTPLAVVSLPWAVSHFGSAAAAVGQAINVDGKAAEIAGVAAPGFRYPKATDIWAPLGIVPDVPVRTAHNYYAVGKLKPGVALASAREDLRIIGDRIAVAYPDNRLKSVALTPLQDRLTTSVQATLWVLMGAVATVLLIACANIANLLLARAATRTREVALRVALGASRGRVARQLLTEYLLLALVATTAGVALAQVLLHLLLAIAPAGLPRLDEVGIDRTVLLFALGASILSTLLFGLVPALQASRLDLTESLKRGGAKGAVSGGGSGRLRSALVAIEVALSLMLLVGAGLLLRSFQELHRVDLGFATDHLLTVDTSFSINTPEDDRRAGRFYRELIDRVRALPGVAKAGGLRYVPFGSGHADSGYLIEGRPAPPPGVSTSADIQVITPGYFETLRLPLRAGRDFSEGDTEDTPLVVVINETLARAAFPGGSALGQRIKTGYAMSTFTWMEIVGVVADARRADPSRPAAAELFIPAWQHPTTVQALSVLVRSPQAPDTLTPALRDIVRQLNPDVPVRFGTVDEAFAQALAYPRFRTVLVSAFAALAVLLAVVGLFSVLAYLVGQRTKEFAVRFAMGAGTADVVGLVVREGLRLVAVGVAAGLAGALALSRLLKGLLYGVGAWDPGTYAAIIALLTVAALVACVLPAWRAAGVNPLVSLRHD